MQTKQQLMLCCPADLVFIQNGMLQPWLDARGLGNNTQVQQSHQQIACMHKVTNFLRPLMLLHFNVLYVPQTSIHCRRWSTLLCPRKVRRP